MPKFEDKFVHFRWSDDLEGKKVFYGDSLDQLEQRFVIETSRGHLHKSTSTEYPFEIACVGNWKFIYFDPNYDLKKAYENGKTIQFKNHTEWLDVTGEPVWSEDNVYRIKPDDSYAVVIAAAADKLTYIHASEVTHQHVFFRGSQDACHNYIVSHAKFTECMIAHLDNKQIQSRLYGRHTWVDASDPTWSTNYEYRIKPDLTWADLHIGDTVRQYNGSIVSMVTAFDMAEDVNSHVQISGWGWLNDSELAEKWTKI